MKIIAFLIDKFVHIFFIVEQIGEELVDIEVSTLPPLDDIMQEFSISESNTEQSILETNIGKNVYSVTYLIYNIKI